MLDFDALARAAVHVTPFRFMVGSGVVTEADAGAIRRDYPDIRKSGYVPLSDLRSEGAFAALVADLQSPRLAEILTEKLALDLAGKPRMITVRKLSKIGDGRIHNDSVSKICTMLVYLNDGWSAGSAGAIRALNGPDDMDDFAAEAPPVAGAVFAFARSETSWHGHPPFAGERYVVQTTFLQSEADLTRKENRGRLQTMLKSLNPFAG
ncbi:MAG: 2OG-Fe(II) oxygenase [Parvularculaceae bacterium]|nr:2OG-Fe(II) oxygenase [Parvularculaceae bacterium]